jgi:hypothetical protein
VRPQPQPAPAVEEDAGPYPDQTADTEPDQPEEGKLRARQMRIWGEVRVILKNKHAKLPPLEQKKTASKADPHATVINATPYTLTVWLAGPCLQKLELKPQKETSLDFCAGNYVVAAKVSESSFLPLVRENQTFEVGIRYTLRIQVKIPPKTTRTKRWVR